MPGRNHQTTSVGVTSAPNDTSVTKARKPKHYKRIKFKAWRPEGAPDPEQHGTVSFKVTPKPSTARIEKQCQVESESVETKNAIVWTKFTYRCPSPLQNLPVNGHRQDPFVTLPIEASECVTSSIDFFLATCVPENRNSEWLVGQPNPHMALLFPFMLTHAMLFETIVALCRASILMAQGKVVEEDRGFVYHHVRAIRAIGANLTTTEGLSDESILSVAMILTLEFLIGNEAAVATHVSGIRRMADMRPDLDGTTKWKRFVKAGVTAYESLGSFVTGKPPPVPKDCPAFMSEAFDELGLKRPPMYPTVPFEPELCMVLARLPSGLAEVCLSGKVSEQTIRLLALITKTTSDRNIVEEYDERTDHEIQVAISALWKLRSTKRTQLELFLQTGLLAFTFQLRKLRPLNLFHDPALRYMVELLSQHEKPEHSRSQEMLVWVSLAAAGAFALRITRMPRSWLVLDRMFELYPKTRQWSYVEGIIRSFLFTEQILSHWKESWSVGLDRWTKIARQGGQPEKETTETPVSRAEVTAHTRGMVYSIADMMASARRCPFQARSGPSMNDDSLRFESLETTPAASEQCCPMAGRVSTPVT
jgi:hypothetical protein